MQKEWHTTLTVLAINRSAQSGTRAKQKQHLKKNGEKITKLQKRKSKTVISCRKCNSILIRYWAQCKMKWEKLYTHTHAHTDNYCIFSIIQTQFRLIRNENGIWLKICALCFNCSSWWQNHQIKIAVKSQKLNLQLN